MVARLVLDGECGAPGQQAPLVEREIGRRVVEQRMPAPLGFQEQRKGRVAADIDAVDRVHLTGDAKGHATMLVDAALCGFQRSRAEAAEAVRSLVHSPPDMKRSPGAA